MVSRYEKEFYSALDRGKEHGFIANKQPSKEGRLLSPEIIDVVRIALNDQIKGNIDLMAGECFKVHFMMRPIIESILNTRAYFTIGYIKLDGQYIHKMELDELLSRLSGGPITTQNTSLHAWITLPTMEVIDLTTMTSKAKAERRPANQIDIIWGESGSFDVEFYPQLAGNE